MRRHHLFAHIYTEQFFKAALMFRRLNYQAGIAKPEAAG